MIKNYCLALVPALFAISCSQTNDIPASKKVKASTVVAAANESDDSADESLGADGKVSAEIEDSSESEAPSAQALADAQANIDLFLDDTGAVAQPKSADPAAGDFDAAISARVKAAAKVIIGRLDTDKSGDVSLEEFIAISSSSPLDKIFNVQKTPEQIAEIQKLLTEKFNKLSGGGALTAEKLEASIKAQFESMKKVIADKLKEMSAVVIKDVDAKILPKFDTNGDGKIDEAELKALQASVVDFRKQQASLGIEAIKKAIEAAKAAQSGQASGSVSASGSASAKKPGA